MSSRIGTFGYSCLALALMAAAGSASAQHWSAPSALSADGNWTFPQAAPQVGIDSSGNALVVWQGFGTPIYYSTHAPKGAWTTAAAASTSGNLYGMHLAANGDATIVAADNSIFTLDRPAGGGWAAPSVLATPVNWGEYALDVPLVLFVADANGDQAVVWEQRDGGTAPETIMAIRRPAGGAWGPAEQVFSQAVGGHAPLAGATMGPTGDLLVTWETYQTVCVGKKCGPANFTLYAGREQAGATVWNLSGALSPAISNTYGYFVQPVIDAAGQGALVYTAVNDQTSIQAVRQNASTLAWQAPVTVYSNPNGMGLAATATGGSTQASIAFVSDTTSGAAIAEIDGNLSRGSWGAPQNLASADASGPLEWMAFAGNAKGERAALWYDLDGSVRVALRKTASGAFGAAATLLAGGCANNAGQCFTPAPAAVAMNAAGQAAAVFQQPVVVGTAWSLFATATN